MMQRRKKLPRVLCLWLAAFGAIYVNFGFFPDMQPDITPVPPTIVDLILPIVKPPPLTTNAPPGSSGITTRVSIADETSRFIEQDGKHSLYAHANLLFRCGSLTTVYNCTSF
jgi:hypothetical protein